MKVFRYNIDAESGLPHIYEHGVDETEVEEVFSSKAIDLAGRNNTRIRMGQTANGRYLRIIYSPDKDGIGIFIVTAYDLRGNALTAFRRMRRRGFR